MKAGFGRRRFRRRRGRVEDFHDALKDIHNGGLMDIQTDFEFLGRHSEDKILWKALKIPLDCLV